MMLWLAVTINLLFQQHSIVAKKFVAQKARREFSTENKRLVDHPLRISRSSRASGNCLIDTQQVYNKSRFAKKK